MKKLFAAAIVIASLSACHYGQNEAKETLQRNEEYKNEKADYSVNRAGEYGSATKSEAKVDTTASATDTTAKH